ncbi:PulJ/GspJ family protein [Desulfatitalea tepidiphila]|uniref:PulJ/GspJ family protein n=1 Tax=Desulfatitalea tepidiphila TaxID=1185843 RepID=UPI0006B4C5A3|nr:prepilin-type N-terminal cleavage/methylation domain-containing protein [Desulfatitalea tepidiphila]
MAFHPGSCTNRSRHLGNSGGFTFIEVLLSLVLMAILASIFGMGLVAAMEGYDFSRANTNVSQKGQLAMARVIRELTELSYIHHIVGENTIIYQRIQDNASGIPTPRNFAIQFSASDQTLRLHTDVEPDIETLIPDSGDILVNDVQNFALQYHQGENLLAWEFDLNLLSTIQIRLNLNRPDAPGRTQNFVTLVHMRNTDNLGGAAP